PCADRSSWVRATSDKYHVSFDYPPACFPGTQEILNGLSLTGDGEEFLRLQLVENELDPADHLGAPKEPWISAIKKQDWNYLQGDGEAIGAVVPATMRSHMLFLCVVKRPIPAWPEFLKSPRHEVCAKIRASIRPAP